MGPRQLSLPVTLRDTARFANFYSQPPSSQHGARAFLERSLIPASETFAYLWGTGAGVTHLLRAASHQLAAAGEQVQYLSLAEFIQQPPEAVCADLEQAALVCLDDIQAVAGNPAWEAELFSLYNRIRDHGGRLLVAANCPPRQLALQLSDLRSRLVSGSVFHLVSYNDDDKVAILRFRAAGLGLQLDPGVARFIVHRAPREMAALMSCLQHLDRAALHSQRKPTVPFLKQVFGW